MIYESPAPDGDAEIEALLGFTPVRRHTRRHDGRSPDLQGGSVAALARLGNVARAAHEVGRTDSGACKARTSAAGLPPRAADGNADAEGAPAQDGPPSHTPTGDEP